MELERLERLKLENAVKTGSLADDDKVGLTSKSPAQLLTASALAKIGSFSGTVYCIAIPLLVHSLDT